MKRAFGLGVGVAWATASVAGEPMPVSVYGPAIPTATRSAELPVGLKYAATPAPTGIAAAAADLPIAPTVPAPYATKSKPVTTQTVSAPKSASSQPAPAETEQVQAIVPAPTPYGPANYGVVDAAAPVVIEGGGCDTCGGAVEGHRRGAFGGRIFNWLTFKPAPPVLPRFTPTPYQAPLMSYFPNGPVPIPTAPGPVQYGPAVAEEPAPAVAVPTPKEAAPAPAPTTPPVTPPPPPMPPAPKRLLKNTPADNPADRPRYLIRGATPEAGDITRVAAQTPAADAPDATAKPVAVPVVPAPTPVVPVASAYAPFDTALVVSHARVFLRCEQHVGHIPCTGHGNLHGFRFAMPVVTPCQPPGPLMVKDCSASGGCASGNCGGTDAVVPPQAVVSASAIAPVEKVVTASALKSASTDASRPFTNP